MINKEIILGNGNIVKDFSDRSIPQNSHNQVCVSFLIPSNQFNDYDDYSVLTAVSRKVGNSTTQLNALVLTASKSITIEGINYIKFSCVLSIDYTNVLGELYFSPYIQATLHTDLIEDADEETEDIEVEVKQLLSQNGFTNCKLNIIRAVAIQEDASVEDLTIASTLASQINSKKIYYNATWNSLTDASENMLYYNIATGYNPSVALYNGSIVAIKNQNIVSYYFPYLNGANIELLKMTNEGVFYKISGISRTGEGTVQSPYVYNATKQKLTYIKAEIDTALNLKVDKTTEINGHALSGNVDLTKGDVGLGNVANYGVETTPTAVGNNLYITSKGVYDALQVIYGIINGLATESQITTINGRLDSIEALLGDGTDDDNIINTLYEVVQTLSGLGEDANILSMINSKVSQSDFDTLNSQINGTNGIATKVSFLYDSNANAYAEITGGNDTINVLVGDWVENTGDTNYPYKWELSNGYLVGASYVSVVFDKDSDTSMLSATIGIDDENGKVILYASELPSDIIQIQKIAIFNSANAYILYNQTLINQVASNTSAISDINNTKLPQYAKKEYVDTSNNTKTTIERDADGRLQLKCLSTLSGGKYSDILLDMDAIWIHTYDGTNTHTMRINEDGRITMDGNDLADNGFWDLSTDTMTIGTNLTTSISNITNLGTFIPKPNDLVIDANNVLGKVISVDLTYETMTITPLRQLGGGSKKHTHNILFYNNHNVNSGYLFRGRMTIESTISTAFTKEQLESILANSHEANGKICAFSESLKPAYLIWGIAVNNGHYLIKGILIGNDNGFNNAKTLNTQIDVGTYQNDGTTQGFYFSDVVSDD